MAALSSLAQPQRLSALWLVCRPSHQPSAFVANLSQSARPCSRVCATRSSLVGFLSRAQRRTLLAGRRDPIQAEVQGRSIAADCHLDGEGDQQEPSGSGMNAAYSGNAKKRLGVRAVQCNGGMFGFAYSGLTLHISRPNSPVTPMMLYVPYLRN
jgi:hypothetical protein